MAHATSELPTRMSRTSRLVHSVSITRAIGPEAIALAVHGLVLFVAVVGATYVADYPAWKMSLLSGGSIVLFYVAHLYAAVLAHQHTVDASVWTELRTIGGEARRMLPLLQACIAPALPLLAATVGLLPLPIAYAASLTIAIASLAAVGFFALHSRQASLRRCLVSAAAAAGFGAAIIAAETFLH